MLFTPIQRIYIIAMLVIAWFIQTYLYLNPDVGWFYVAAKRLLVGGTYSNDFFENNPPWIIYLNTVPVLLSKISGFSSIDSIKFCVFSLAIFSLLLSQYYLKRIFLNKGSSIALIFLVILTFIFLILPIYELGQREHLMFMATMPYFLMMAVRYQQDVVDAKMALITGFLAGIFFILKPYFLISLCLVELVYIFRLKNFKALIRPELMAISFLLFVYLAIIFTFHLDYIKYVLPLAMRYCYLGSRDLWLNILFNKIMIISYFSVLFYLLTYRTNQFRSLSFILFLMWVGFFLSYVLQQEVVYYRIFPVYSVSILLYALCFFVFVKNPNKTFNDYLLVICYVIFFSSYLLSNTYFIHYCLFFFPFQTLAFVTLICSIFFYLISIKWNLKYWMWFLCIFFSFGLFIYYESIYFSLWVKLGLILLAAFLYFLLLPRDTKSKFDYFIYLMLACVISIFHIFFINEFFNSGYENKKSFNKLVNFIDYELTADTTYYFTTWINHYLQQKSILASRFPFFWPLPGLVKKSYFQMNANDLKQYEADKNYFIDMIANDLNRYQPRWVLVESGRVKNYLIWKTMYTTKIIPFDYLTYFSYNKNFENSWKKYYFYKQISVDFHIYINPFQYSLNVLYQKRPSDSLIEPDNLYLYLNNMGQPELALNDSVNGVKRIIIDSTKANLFWLMDLLNKTNNTLTTVDKFKLISILSKQVLTFEAFKYDVYERS